ncbi:FAD binding domain-containing protein [Xylogone sp. PMI_703]|nr:FAD binding domain-containing protein [Xylogone sp. PMI_703]
MEKEDSRQSTDHLIVGAGPAGGSLGCFLGQHGLKGLIISAAPGTAHTPRAHITNPAAIECLGDIGLAEEVYTNAHKNEKMANFRLCQTLLGREYARLYSWGPSYQASPYEHADIPQTLLEPILLRYAAQHGFPCRFSTELLNFEDRDDDGVVATVYDRISTHTYKIKSKKMYGADGARSRVVEQLKLPITSLPSGGAAYNVIFKADLTQRMTGRIGNLHMVIRPDIDLPDYAMMCTFRMVKPWHEWIAIIYGKPGYRPKETLSPEAFLEPINLWIGDDQVDIKILRVDAWERNEVSVNMYSKGNVYCLGDAVHRHPPTNGLGSNTCIQDAYNLAWKVAYVEKGLAGDKLLASYNSERQPVGSHIINLTKEHARRTMPVLKALGATEPTKEARIAAIALLDDPSPSGVNARTQFLKNMAQQVVSFQGIGAEMNQRYRSEAIYLEDQGPQPELPDGDKATLEYFADTFPGCRLPHVWLSALSPEERVSTVQLAGDCRFSIFTGMAGAKIWKSAAASITHKLKIELPVFVIGMGGEWISHYGDWEAIRGVEESGCILVRPDRYVGWRSNSGDGDTESKLEKVLRFILSR